MNQNNNKRSKTIRHSFYLLLTVFIIFLWAITPYQEFATQIIATLLALFITKHIYREHLTASQESLIDSLVLTAMILVIITSTGGLSSPVFFLIFFLIFVLSLLLDPAIPLVLSFSLIIYFLFTSTITKSVELLPLFSFPLITPLAVYFGREHKKSLFQKQDIYHLNESIRRETTDVMLWLSTTYAREMRKLTELLDSIPNVTDPQKPIIHKARDSAHRLKRLGEKLKQAIEED